MANRLENFAQAFKGFEDCYTIIGGVAAETLMNEVGLTFRATKDVDVVVLMEGSDLPGFRTALLAFLRQGGYTAQCHKTGAPCLYRFVEPTEARYPSMIELFTWHELRDLSRTCQVVPLPLDEAASSLSAILLDKDYYALLRDHRRIIDGIPFLDANALIPFKMKAWLDLSDRKSSGEQIDSRKIKKHRNDVLRLQTLLDPSMKISLPQSISEDARRFLEVSANDDATLQSLKIRGPWSSIKNRIAQYYGLTS